MRPLTLAALVFLALSALADPFGPPTQLSETSAPRVEVASTSAGPLVVWLDDSGVLRANGRTVASAAVRVATASVGDTALVVWTQADGSVWARRLSPDGSSSGVVRKIGSSAAGPVAVAAADGRYFVAWPGLLGQIYAAIVSPLGGPIVPAMPVTAQSGSTIGEIAAAASADGFAVVWHDLEARDVFATTLDTNGVPVSMTPLLVSDDGGFPDVASDGTTFLIVWGLGTIHARTLTVDGDLGRTRTVTLGVAPRIAWDGLAYSMAYVHQVYPRPGFSFQQLTAMRLTSYGTYVERLSPANTLMPRIYDVDARSGRFDLGHSVNSVWVQSAMVGEPRTRVRAMRH
ncbi:MAG TPA: hypothetical protein VF432_00875 [Thermoanaerobaculia bacterium]